MGKSAQTICAQQRKQHADRRKADLLNDPHLKKAYSKIKVAGAKGLTYIAEECKDQQGKTFKKYILDPAGIDRSLRNAWKKIYEGCTREPKKLIKHFRKKTMPTILFAVMRLPSGKLLDIVYTNA